MVQKKLGTKVELLENVETKMWFSPLLLLLLLLISVQVGLFSLVSPLRSSLDQFSPIRSIFSSFSPFPSILGATNISFKGSFGWEDGKVEW